MNVDCPLIIRHCIICGLVAECFFAQLLSIDSKFQIEQFFIIMIIFIYANELLYCTSHITKIIIIRCCCFTDIRSEKRIEMMKKKAKLVPNPKCAKSTNRHV